MPKPTSINKRLVTLIVGIAVAIFITALTLGSMTSDVESQEPESIEQIAEPKPEATSKVYLETASKYAYMFFVFVNKVKEEQ